MNKRRSSIQLEQEKKSRLQLEERLSDFGWHLATPSPDLGEDFIVQIYHEGQNTGVNFYIQEKSVTNLEERKTKDNNLVYTLKVKDLKHWEKFSLPVVVFVWDVNLREGKWGLVKEIISRLDISNPKWRKNKSDVQVYLPWENGSDNKSLKRLKSEIGKQVYPLISSGKDLSLTMKLAFPKTPEGMELKKAFDLHLKEGESVTLKGDVIQELKFSDWWETWFGGFDLKNAEIQIGENSINRQVPISLKIIPNKGKTVSLKNLEFKPVRIGTELIKFSNEHTSCPLLLTISMRRDGKESHGNINCTFREMGGDPHDMLGYLDFVIAMGLGGKMRVDFHDVNQSTSADFPSTNQTVIDSGFYDLIQKLCVIQDKTGVFLKVPSKGISGKDAEAIRELFEVVEGRIVTYEDMIMSIGLKGEALKMLLSQHKEKKPIHLLFTFQGSYIELFGEKIETGPMEREVTGFIEMDAIELEEAVNKMSPEELLDIKLVNVNGTEKMLDWYIEKIN